VKTLAAVLLSHPAAFGHLATLAVAALCLPVVDFAQMATVAAERFVIPLEDDVFAQLTFNRAVEDRNLLLRRQADFGDVFVLSGDYPCMIPLEHVL